MLWTLFALTDFLGDLPDPFSVEVSGLWARRRAWTPLPMEYRESPGNYGLPPARIPDAL
jgi:hypothetical protein